MTTPLAPFVAPSRTGNGWFFAGLTSSFPNLIESGTEVVREPRLCGNGKSVPGCKVFNIPAGDISQARQVEGEEMTLYNGAALRDQVLVFQYKGKIHAVDNWEVQLRPVEKSETEQCGDDRQKANEDIQEEVWVRRKQRIG
ncbi:hypothetical protein O1611_g4585 [Lasiodiplodia mahajangana]|uniref:Uncharacterized protein n=1 Tax=Lasiodiplodia mahajangana TaxID=1108764 RepID=A0ACC2JNW7_9PEZI|nr:hypothetical protein O1611_g4585 [Lasiodiplodia mahajangana]